MVTDPCSALESLYSLTNYLLQKSYEASDPALVALGNDLCGAAIDLVARAPSGSVVPLKQMQEGLGIWAKDPAHRVTKNVSNRHLFYSRSSQRTERLLEPNQRHRAMGAPSRLHRNPPAPRQRGLVESQRPPIQWFREQTKIDRQRNHQNLERNVWKTADAHLPAKAAHCAG